MKAYWTLLSKGEIFPFISTPEGELKHSGVMFVSFPININFNNVKRSC